MDDGGSRHADGRGRRPVDHRPDARVLYAATHGLGAWMLEPPKVALGQHRIVNCEGPPPGGPSHSAERLVVERARGSSRSRRCARRPQSVQLLSSSPGRPESRPGTHERHSLPSGACAKRRAVADEVGTLEQPMILDGDHQRDEHGSDGDDAEQARRLPSRALSADSRRRLDPPAGSAEAAALVVRAEEVLRAGARHRGRGGDLERERGGRDDLREAVDLPRAGAVR